MEYRTVSTKLPSNELTLFRAHCDKKGVTPANLLKKLILREMQITIPQVIAGKNKISYNKSHDSITWSIELDIGKNITLIENVPVSFVENLFDSLKIVLQERETSIQKKKKGSVPIPSDFLGGKLSC